MSHLGSECQNGLIYEGRDNPSHLAVPTPIISQCALVRPGFQGATYRLIHISAINSLGERICCCQSLNTFSIFSSYLAAPYAPRWIALGIFFAMLGKR
ncbi:hypothetical protein CJO94_12680 [Ralstonia solanacearum]|nr:hypothetical protein CJO94_12680 [Ralstonia solanacearum]